MQQWKISKARLHTGYRLSGRSERNSAGPTLEKMSRDRSLTPDPSSSSASGVDLTREVTPGPIESESVMSTSSSSSSPEDHAQAEDLPNSVPVDSGEAPRSTPVSSAGLTVNDYGDELARGESSPGSFYSAQESLAGSPTPPPGEETQIQFDSHAFRMNSLVHPVRRAEKDFDGLEKYDPEHPPARWTDYEERFDPNIRSRLETADHIIGMSWNEWLRRLDEWRASQGISERTLRDKKGKKGNGGNAGN